MNKYEKGKARARAKAIEHQAHPTEKSYFDLFITQVKFCKLAKRYGLTKEFKENGII